MHDRPFHCLSLYLNIKRNYAQALAPVLFLCVVLTDGPWLSGVPIPRRHEAQLESYEKAILDEGLWLVDSLLLLHNVDDLIQLSFLLRNALDEEDKQAALSPSVSLRPALPSSSCVGKHASPHIALLTIKQLAVHRDSLLALRLTIKQLAVQSRPIAINLTEASLAIKHLASGGVRRSVQMSGTKAARKGAARPASAAKKSKGARHATFLAEMKVQVLQRSINLRTFTAIVPAHWLGNSKEGPAIACLA
eukprot:1161317-Pelagomonas_calceolata.AAC.1